MHLKHVCHAITHCCYLLLSQPQISGPSDHPLLDDDGEFQRFVRANTGESHRFFDGSRVCAYCIEYLCINEFFFAYLISLYIILLQGYIQRPDGLPRGHPNCDDYFIYEGESRILLIFYSSYSQSLLTVGIKNDLLLFISKEIPEADLPTVYFGHPDIHEAYLNGERLPQGHPSASSLVSGNFICKSTYLTHSTKKVHIA